METNELTNYGSKSLRHALLAIVFEVLSGVFSLLSIPIPVVGSALGWFALGFSISALIAGIKSLRAGETESRGSAIAGLVISSILILIRIIILFVLIVAILINL